MDGTTEKAEDKNLFWWIAGGCTAAVIGIGTCVYLLFKKKSEKKDEPKQDEKPAEKAAA
jgi:hypothetical protein